MPISPHTPTVKARANRVLPLHATVYGLPVLIKEARLIRL
ncbi:hypothetical protein QF035_010705 [Streptomyces umbrinus]|uniref:Uncharacterized protein n=1 Tax=Streptomyces umbrinus TaxID=67370 RepID=A0ABU0TBD8_9ACTN|nr:hypothetical protein [Streptomyces umbrinus]